MPQVLSTLTRPAATATGPSFRIIEHGDDFVEIAFIGAQTEQNVDGALAVLLPILEARKKRGIPMKLLADNQRITRTTIGANQRVLRAFREIPFQKAAGINANPLVRFIIGAIIGAAGVGRRVKLFESRERAEAWLLKR